MKKKGALRKEKNFFQKPLDKNRNTCYTLIIKRKEIKNMKYDVIVAGSVINTFKTRVEAEKYLEQVRNSWLSLVHPQEVFRIKERA